jgi:hypothetical protein
MDKTIMTVDGSGGVRRMVSFTFRESGYQVIEKVIG